jgi:hypothetical protein
VTQKKGDPTDAEILALVNYLRVEGLRFSATGISMGRLKAEADRAALSILRRMEEEPLETREGAR